MWDDSDPLFDLVAETLRPAAGVLPDQPSDDELAALRAAVDQQFPKGRWRPTGGRRPLPMLIGAAAAAALLSTAGVAAAATSVVEPLRLAQTVAHDIGLPVEDPNVSDAHSTLHDLTAAYQRHDVQGVVREMGELRTELRRVDYKDRSRLMRQITAKTPAIAIELSMPPPVAPDPTTATAPTGTTVPTDSRTDMTVPLPPPDTSTTLPTDTTPTDPSTTVPPDTTPTTVPPDTTPTTVPPDTTPTTVPPDTTPTDPSTTAPPDTQKAPDTTTTIPGQSQTETTTTSVP